MSDVLLNVLTVFMIFLIVFNVMLLFKNSNCYDNCMRIINAIAEYCVEDSIPLEECLNMYNRIESYESTLFRLWDWGYTRIVDKETFDLIKPYIKEKERKEH